MTECISSLQIFLHVFFHEKHSFIENTFPEVSKILAIVPLGYWYIQYLVYLGPVLMT